MTLLGEIVGARRRLGAALCVLAAASGLATILAAAPVVQDDRVIFTADELARIYRRSPLEAPPPGPVDGVADSVPAAALGQFLFFDPSLSPNANVPSPTSPHPPPAFTDVHP